MSPVDWIAAAIAGITLQHCGLYTWRGPSVSAELVSLCRYHSAGLGDDDAHCKRSRARGRGGGGMEIEESDDGLSHCLCLCPVYTLDNGHSLTYATLVEVMGRLGRPVLRSPTYESWLAQLAEALTAEEDHESHPYRNPLRDLRGALMRKQPKFGSTGCQKHMNLLACLGFPVPVIDEKYLSVCLRRYESLGFLPHRVKVSKQL